MFKGHDARRAHDGRDASKSVGGALTAPMELFSLLAVFRKTGVRMGRAGQQWRPSVRRPHADRPYRRTGAHMP
jgi:hypothetical protein